ncbi:MAG: M48 family metalloprotease [Acidobacteriia bacterium]|nr:M48 family metalloprotease [Terriglobia bacterium]
MRRQLLAVVLCLPFAAYPQRTPKQVEVKVQKTSLTREQEAAIGKEAAAQVEREMEIVRNPEIEGWLNQIGQRLAKTPQANAYPYYFKLVNEPSINAFALPGGPMYVHAGLLQAADSEGEVAGVLAHEMSHVALRHGAAQIGKQQTWGALFGLAGAAVGAITTGENGECGWLCQIGQTGAGIGGNSVLMKFSRGFERDADLNGARMMASAGYDPMQLPRFFEKLETKLGSAAEPKGLALWLSSHPATGSRVQYVADDIKFYPKGSYTADTGRFPRIKQVVASLPAPQMKPAKLVLAKEGAAPRRNLPAGFKDYQANGFAVAYPGSWRIGQGDGGGSLYLVPQGGAVRGQNGVELLAGAMVDYYAPAGSVQLDASTREFLTSMQKGDANLRAETSERVNVGGKPGLKTRMTTRTSLQQEPDQVIYLYTVARAAGLWYVALAAQPSRLGDFEPVFGQMIGTVQFPD